MTEKMKRKDSNPSLAVADLEAYRKLIDQLAAGAVNKRVANSLQAHAAVLFETMFRYAREEIRIFTGEMQPEVYGDPRLIDAARRFLLRPGACLRILIQKSRDALWLAEQPLIRATKQSAAAIDVRRATGVYQTEEAKHFAVMDSVGFRYELSHPDTRAFANFNEPEVAQGLALTFDRAFALGDALPVPAATTL